MPIGWELLNLTCPAALPAIADLRAVEPCEWLHAVAERASSLATTPTSAHAALALARKSPHSNSLALSTSL